MRSGSQRSPVAGRTPTPRLMPSSSSVTWQSQSNDRRWLWSRHTSLRPRPPPRVDRPRSRQTFRPNARNDVKDARGDSGGFKIIRATPVSNFDSPAVSRAPYAMFYAFDHDRRMSIKEPTTTESKTLPVRRLVSLTVIPCQQLTGSWHEESCVGRSRGCNGAVLRAALA